MRKVLVSSCLVGCPVRYDGTAATSANPVLSRWLQEGRVVPFCPEVAGGLDTPRAPVELCGRGDMAKARQSDGTDVTEAFLAGAQGAVDLCREKGIRLAVLKERSPSCGSLFVYDGSFSGTLIRGQGMTAAALREQGVLVFSEEQWEQARTCLSELESRIMGDPPRHRMERPEG